MSDHEALEATNEDDRAIGVRLKELRTASGMSQTELAKRMVAAGRANFTQTTVSRLENGIQALRVDDMRALVKVFGPGAERLWTFEWSKSDDLPFWERLGHEGGLPVHFPISLNRYGQGPTEPEPAHHYGCWCGDLECPLSIALHYGWLAGRRSAVEPGVAVNALLRRHVREFVQWVAANRAYNGSDFPYGQSLYNECLNGELPKWAEDWIDEREGRSSAGTGHDHMTAAEIERERR